MIPFNAAILSGVLSIIPLLTIAALRKRRLPEPDIGMGIPFRLRDSGEE